MSLGWLLGYLLRNSELPYLVTALFNSSDQERIWMSISFSCNPLLRDSSKETQKKYESEIFFKACYSPNGQCFELPVMQPWFLDDKFLNNIV